MPMRAPLSAPRTKKLAYDALRLASAGAVTESAGSLPTTTSKTATASATVRAIGPATSADALSGITPAREVSPMVERMPTSA